MAVLVAGRPPLPIVGSEPVFLYLAQRRRTWRALTSMLSAIAALGVAFSFSRMIYLILSSSSLTRISRLRLCSPMGSRRVRLIRGGHSFVTIRSGIGWQKVNSR